MANKQTASEKYSESMKNQGFTKSCVWVPDDDTEKLQKYAHKLRKAKIKKDSNG